VTQPINERNRSVVKFSVYLLNTNMKTNDRPIHHIGTTSFKYLPDYKFYAYHNGNLRTENSQLRHPHKRASCGRKQGLITCIIGLTNYHKKCFMLNSNAFTDFNRFIFISCMHNLRLFSAHETSTKVFCLPNGLIDRDNFLRSIRYEIGHFEDVIPRTQPISWPTIKENKPNTTKSNNSRTN